MRLFAILFVILFAAITSAAQIASFPAQVASFPVAYGFSNSVIGHDGALWIFDATYQYPPPTLMSAQAIPVRFPPIVTTHITMVDSKGNKLDAPPHSGTFYVAGVGRYAVYAIITDYVVNTTGTQTPVTYTRTLVALGPAFPTTMPSIPVPMQADVKVSAVGDDSAPDEIVFIDREITPLMLGLVTQAGDATSVTPMAQPRTVQMIQSDGKSFTKPIVVSLQ
jgi:hypothetical protein